MIYRFTGDYKFLSNFYESPIIYNGLKYNSAEAAFQASKSSDRGVRKEFCNLGPGEAKRKGRQVRLREDWENAKLMIMRQIIYIKFNHSPLREMLISTGNQELIEGNSWGDRFWGVSGGTGKNNLGKILMNIRSLLLEEPLPL